MRLPLAALLLMPLLVASVPEAAAVAPRAPELPSLDAGHWLNSPPLTLAALRGRPVLIEFWTFGCSNCRNTLPWLEHVHARYSPKGLTVIAVHTPEFRRRARPGRGRASGRAARHPLPAADRQWLCVLALARQPVLAGVLSHRYRGAHRRHANRRAARGRPPG